MPTYRVNDAITLSRVFEVIADSPEEIEYLYKVDYAEGFNGKLIREQVCDAHIVEISEEGDHDAQT